jgi:hypothetical protein
LITTYDKRSFQITFRKKPELFKYENMKHPQ